MYASIVSALVAAAVMYLAWRGFASRRSASPAAAAPSSRERGGHPIALDPEKKIPMKLVEKKVGSYKIF